MAEVRLTAEGIKKYEERLEYLKTTGRTEIAEQIKIARSFGDLSENAEYDAAKAEQARMEYEIVEIENMLKNVVLIDEDNINTDMVNIGTTVRVRMTALGVERSVRRHFLCAAMPVATLYSLLKPCTQNASSM